LATQPQQYAPPGGTPLLKGALAQHAATFARVPVDPDAGVLVTTGATEALAAAILGLIRPGDEAVIIEPAYDSYAPLVRAAGGAVVPLRLVAGSGWALPPAAQVAAAFSPRTRLLLLNTPHNPTGKAFTLAELEVLADAVKAAGPGCVAVCDEVYEHLAHPPTPHTSLASLPGMAARCLRIGSAGKTFSMTGLKVGWVTGPPPLVAAAARCHQFLVFCVPPALQAGVVEGLTHECAFIASLGPTLAAKQALLARCLARAGFAVLPGDATYFLIADAAALMTPDEDDVSFCQRMVARAGVAAVPASPFYFARAAVPAPRTLVRFCFCKQDAVLQAAGERLEAYFGEGGGGRARGG
jgi:aspartate/methionine/tyrosine aminotransferase